MLFAAVMFGVQILEHTSLAYSLLYLGFFVLSVVAFNVAGGFSTVPGAYVFWFSMLSNIVGVTTKAALGQAADANLSTPLLDIACYTCSAFMLLLVVVANKTFDLRPRSIAVRLDAGNLNFTRVALGCLISGIAVQLLDTFASSLAGPGSALAALNQLNVFFPLAMIFGTVGAIKDSGGRRSTSFVSALSIGTAFTIGTLAFSKQGMISPMVCWAVGAAYMRLKLRKVHFLVLALCTIFTLKVANPLSSVRDEVPEGATQTDRLELLIHAITHWDEVKARQANEREFALEHDEGGGYFNNADVGILGRFTIVPVDDVMFSYTAKGHYVGYTTVLLNFEGWVPHFIAPNKVSGYNGNYYAHEVGGFLAADDFTTGISFSPVAEAYHIGGWPALFLLLPAIWWLMFATIDFIAGDMRFSPWGLFLVLYFAHAGAESLLSGLIYYTGYGNLSMIFAMFFCTRMAPIIGSIFHGRSNVAPPAPPAPPAPAALVQRLPAT
jgi:hypothetical protein